MTGYQSKRAAAQDKLVVTDIDGHVVRDARKPKKVAREPDAYSYAKRLAEYIWAAHYRVTAPQWKPLDDLMGVLTQIDNMTSGLVTPPAAQPAQEPVAWLEPEWGEKICPEVGYEVTMTDDHPKDLGWTPLYPHPPQGEIVAYLVLFEGAGKLLEFTKGNYIHGAKVTHMPLYTAPPQRPWVGLTEEDCKGMSAGDRVVAMWADRTLKEKNT
jgi:hypothetical protein